MQRHGSTLEYCIVTKYQNSKYLKVQGLSLLWDFNFGKVIKQQIDPKNVILLHIYYQLAGVIIVKLIKSARSQIERQKFQT